MQPDEPTDEERQQKLDQDVATPFQPADDTSAAPAADDTHPNTDTSVDSDEQYQEGTTAASNAPAPADPSTDLEDTSDLSDDEETIEDKSL